MGTRKGGGLSVPEDMNQSCAVRALRQCKSSTPFEEVQKTADQARTVGFRTDDTIAPCSGKAVHQEQSIGRDMKGNSFSRDF